MNVVVRALMDVRVLEVHAHVAPHPKNTDPLNNINNNKLTIYEYIHIITSGKGPHLILIARGEGWAAGPNFIRGPCADIVVVIMWMMMIVLSILILSFILLL